MPRTTAGTRVLESVHQFDLSMLQAGGAPPNELALYQELVHRKGIDLDGTMHDGRSYVGDARVIQPGRCLLLDGVDQRLDLETGLLPLTGDCCFCGWFTYETLADSDVVFAQWNNANSGDMRVLYDLGSDEFQLNWDNDATYGADTFNASVLGSPSSGTWYWIYWERDGDQASLYMNNVLQETITVNVAKNIRNGNANLGAQTNSDVSIANVKVFDWRFMDDRVMTVAERTAVYAQGTTIRNRWSPGQPTKYKRVYFCDDNDSAFTTFRDASGNGTDATLTNGDDTATYEGDDVPWSPQNVLGFTEG